MDMHVEHQQDQITVVHLVGRFNLQAASAAKQRFIDLVTAGHTQLVIDLGDVSFVDSSGLGALIGGLKAARLACGDLRIARPSLQAQTLLNLTTLNRVFSSHATMEDARASYQRATA